MSIVVSQAVMNYNREKIVATSIIRLKVILMLKVVHRFTKNCKISLFTCSKPAKCSLGAGINAFICATLYPNKGKSINLAIVKHLAQQLQN